MNETSSLRLSMDLSANLVSERGSGCAPQNSNGTFEELRTTRADSKRARTGNSSSNGVKSHFSIAVSVILKGSEPVLRSSPSLPQGSH